MYQYNEFKVKLTLSLNFFCWFYTMPSWTGPHQGWA